MKTLACVGRFGLSGFRLSWDEIRAFVGLRAFVGGEGFGLGRDSGFVVIFVGRVSGGGDPFPRCGPC